MIFGKKDLEMPLKSIEKEISIYKMENCIKLNDDELDWWRKKSETYPILSEIAKRYLYIPATNSPSERIFSKAGVLMNNKRILLSKNMVNILLFLNHN